MAAGPVLMEGQCWERLGHIVFLPHGMDPNDDPTLTGWVKVTDDQAREVLYANQRDEMSAKVFNLGLV